MKKKMKVPALLQSGSTIFMMSMLYFVWACVFSVFMAIDYLSGESGVSAEVVGVQAVYSAGNETCFAYEFPSGYSDHPRCAASDMKDWEMRKSIQMRWMVRRDDSFYCEVIEDKPPASPEKIKQVAESYPLDEAGGLVVSGISNYEDRPSTCRWGVKKPIFEETRKWMLFGAVAFFMATVILGAVLDLVYGHYNIIMGIRWPSFTKLSAVSLAHHLDNCSKRCCCISDNKFSIDCWELCEKLSCSYNADTQIIATINEHCNLRSFITQHRDMFTKRSGKDFASLEDVLSLLPSKRVPAF